MKNQNSLFQIRNDLLTVSIHEKGATLWSIKDAENMEYLWQGDPKYWEDRAPNLFPYIARLTEGKYILDGKTYEMDIHGFAKDMIFVANQISDNHIVFSISNTEETYRQYPYRFRFEISYKLEESSLSVTFNVINEDDNTMYFGLGGHPGFYVPFEANTTFEDYYLEFDEATNAKRVGFSEDCFITGDDSEFLLEDGKRLFLHHEMFDDDAIVLKDMAHSVTLRTKEGCRAIRVTYPDMPYLGLWHMPRTDAPYICIEPWTSLPSRKSVIEDLATQPGLISLEAESKYENHFSIEIRKARR